MFSAFLLLVTKPYVVLPLPTEPVDLGAESSRIELDGDILTAYHRQSAPQMYFQGGMNEKMTRIEGTDLWGIRLKMEGWDRAFFNYGFSPSPDMLSRAGTWRGPHAPAAPQAAEHLKGKIVETKLHSVSLGEDRKLFIYLPPKPLSGHLPAFYITDGGECERFAKVLEPLILAHRVRPCAIVGVENGGYRGNLLDAPYDPKLNFRGKEYVDGNDPVRFRKHRKFFADEVVRYATKTFGLSSRREDRASMGYSDGARFVLSMASSRPDLFGTILPFSMAGAFPSTFPVKGPRVLLCAGKLEAPIDEWASDLYARLGSKRASLQLYVAGHDPLQWELAFAHYAPVVFPGLAAESGWSKMSTPTANPTQ